MTWGIRRIVFTIGAMLLMGGWGLTGYVDAYQHAAGAAAGVRWREGEQATTATLRQATPVRTEVPEVPDVPDVPDVSVMPDGSIAGGDPIPDTTIAPPPSAAPMHLTRQVLPPSSWLYALGVVGMMTGAGLMALTVPWRGARMAAAAEASPQQHYVSPPAPRAPSMTSPAATAATAAPSFPGVLPLQEARSMAAAPIQATAPEPPAKAGIKPLLYKKGA